MVFRLPTDIAVALKLQKWTFLTHKTDYLGQFIWSALHKIPHHTADSIRELKI